MKHIFGYIDYSSTLSIQTYSHQQTDTTTDSVLSLQSDVLKSSYHDDASFGIVFNGQLHEGKDVISQILELYSDGGFKHVVQELKGVFSLALLDKKSQKLYLSRDHMGIYPLYYYHDKELILFANDLKDFRDIPSFKKEIDPASLALFFQNEYIPAPYTIFKNCYKVLPASFLTIDIQTRQISTDMYWDLKSQYLRPKSDENETQILEKTEALLSRAIEKGIGSDTAIGSFLSGGFDSATILALAHKLNKTENYTFTMGFDESKYNEANIAEEISKHLQSTHAVHILKEEDVLSRLDNIAHIYPEPFADKAAFASMILVEGAKDQVQTLFGGEGGDELFYASSFLPKFKRIQSIPYPLRWVLSKGLKLHPAIKYQKWGAMLGERRIEDILHYKDILMSDAACQRLIVDMDKPHLPKRALKSPKASNFMDNIFPAIIQRYVSNNLMTKLGALSLYHDVDIKLPYLDKDLIEYLATIPAPLKNKNQVRKYLLKEITYKYISKSLIDKPKKGFSVPLASYIKSNFKSIEARYFNQAKIEKEAVLNYNEVQDIIQDFLTQNSYYSEQKMWNLLLFEIWYGYWFDETPSTLS